MGGEQEAGKKLKSTYFWSEKGNGTDEVNFTGLPGGFRHHFGGFTELYESGDWWNSKEISSEQARGCYLNYDLDAVIKQDYFKGAGLYVRCVRDK